MPAMNWTDEAIEKELALCATDQYGVRPSCYRDALLELKRVRAWAKCGLDDWYTLTAIFNGDPAPDGEEK